MSKALWPSILDRVWTSLPDYFSLGKDTTGMPLKVGKRNWVPQVPLGCIQKLSQDVDLLLQRE